MVPDWDPRPVTSTLWSQEKIQEREMSHDLYDVARLDLERHNHKPKNTQSHRS